MKLNKILLFVTVLSFSLNILADLTSLDKIPVEKAEYKAYEIYRTLNCKENLGSVGAARIKIEEFLHDLNGQYATADIYGEEGYKYDYIPQVLGRVRVDIAFLKDLEDLRSGNLTEKDFLSRWEDFSKYAPIVRAALSRE